MKSIWHYPLGRGGYTKVQMPIGAQVLGIQVVMHEVRVYVLVDQDQLTEERTFTTVGTGWTLPDLSFKYVGSYQSEGGVYVWHVLEELP